MSNKFVGQTSKSSNRARGAQRHRRDGNGRGGSTAAATRPQERKLVDKQKDELSCGKLPQKCLTTGMDSREVKMLQATLAEKLLKRRPDFDENRLTSRVALAVIQRYGLLVAETPWSSVDGEVDQQPLDDRQLLSAAVELVQIDLDAAEQGQQPKPGGFPGERLFRLRDTEAGSRLAGSMIFAAGQRLVTPKRL